MSVTEFPETILLEPGGEIEGPYQRKERGHAKDKQGTVRECPIFVLEVDGVDRSLWGWETALKSQFAELKPKPGELVTVTKAREKKLGGNGFEYWPIRVKAPERPVEELGWDDPLLGAENADTTLGQNVAKEIAEQERTDDELEEIRPDDDAPGF